MQDTALPNKKITLQIEENQYTINFPTTGQFIEIQNMKTLLAKGQYNIISSSYDPDDEAAKKYIDMVAFFTVLIPQLKKDLNTASLLDLDLYTTQNLIHNVYEEQFIPWYNSWMEVINKLSVDYYKSKENNK